MDFLQRKLSWSSLLRNGLVASVGVAWVCANSAIAADTYPVKPVRIIVASGAGGGDDFMMRMVAAKLSELLGNQFIVDNRPGA